MLLPGRYPHLQRSKATGAYPAYAIFFLPSLIFWTVGREQKRRSCSLLSGFAGVWRPAPRLLARPWWLSRMAVHPGLHRVDLHSSARKCMLLVLGGFTIAMIFRPTPASTKFSWVAARRRLCCGSPYRWVWSCSYTPPSSAGASRLGQPETNQKNNQGTGSGLGKQRDHDTPRALRTSRRMSTWCFSNRCRSQRSSRRGGLRLFRALGVACAAGLGVPQKSPHSSSSRLRPRP